MGNSIYKTPETDIRTHVKVDIDALCEIGRRQKLMIWALGIQYMIGTVGRLFTGELALILLLVIAVCALINVVVSVVRLSVMVNHLVLTVLLGALSIIPLLNLIVMLVLSRQAIGRLKKNGVSVGLLGASEQEIRTKVISNQTNLA